ncbi:hypothetical protein RchiOBHm_Chr1g0360011 [Rosa chinensis]|uniref:Secreted protein n=1 Tax=Rosa chinensis TaxID=74649 RepID=A0A2P6SIL2_ROSCH|nr:hypothetical protein RchiOBHm_Chr1g0360011 [Rosa chinensis]
MISLFLPSRFVSSFLCDLLFLRCSSLPFLSLSSSFLSVLHCFPRYQMKSSQREESCVTGLCLVSASLRA